jgi:hypothetical protein
VAYLSARGVDPDPMLKTVGALVAAATSVGTLLLQLVNRQTVAKTERNTGVLAAAVYDVADAIPRPGGPRHAYPDIEAAPAASGSLRTGLEVLNPTRPGPLAVAAPGRFRVRHTVRHDTPVRGCATRVLTRGSVALA